jgi:hypothetical protein
MVRFSFCGHDLVALPQGALYWPARRALLFADLHLEKASWFAGRGQMLPPYDTLATWPISPPSPPPRSRRDLVPGRQLPRCRRLRAAAAAACEALADLTRAHRWTWITGNHDPVVPELVGGHAVAEAEIDGLVLRHEADRPIRGPNCPATSTPSSASSSAAGSSRAAASCAPSAS